MFNHKKIEQHWQKVWEDEKTFQTNLDSKNKKYYVLDMFPYPSGSGLHVGHPEGYTASDIIARMKKQQGYEVLHPMGWDAFGLPAEQYAIKTNNHPKDFTQKNIQSFKKQLKTFGFSFDWSREIITTDPSYYKNTQWIFAELFKKGFVELKEMEVNWSPSLNTVLSNEEVLLDENNNSVSERDGLPVQKKFMKQWVLKITKYAERLFKGLDNLDWPDSIKRLQRNWIYERDDKGNYTTDLHLKDWLFARQRYWGEPFPIVFKDNGEIYLIPQSEYPVELPTIKDYSFSMDGMPALSKAKDWINYESKENNIKGKRDLNTMPQWAASCWYYIAYIIKDGDSFLDLDSKEAKTLIDKWLPVDIYIGGQEHAVLHLLYARFWHMFLYDIGIIKSKEPFKKLFNQGMILGSNGIKMSKSRGNVVNPDEIINEYGVDSLRLYLMFMGALEDDKPWTSEGIKASRSWLERVYRLFTEEIKFVNESSIETKQKFNTLLKKVEDYNSKLKFNLSISEMMVFINHCYKQKEIDKQTATQFLQLLSCFCPHLPEEINKKFVGNKDQLFSLKWPKKYDVEKAKGESIVMIQIDGKIRGKLINPKIPESPSDDELILLAKQKGDKFIKEPGKVIYIKNKLISIANKQQDKK